MRTVLLSNVRSHGRGAEVMAILPESLAAPLERTIFDASVEQTLV